jgi:hypothetical protein
MLQVLQDSLCGSSKVLLVCNLSPEATSCNESLSSLNFASRAAQVELGQARRVTGSAPTPTPAAAATPAGGSNADGGGGLSPEPSSNSLKAQQPSGHGSTAASAGGADARGAVRAKSPVFAPGSPGPSPVRVSGGSGGGAPTGAAAGGVGVRPGSCLSDRVSDASVGLAGSGGSMGSGSSPRVSMAKPARH